MARFSEEARYAAVTRPVRVARVWDGRARPVVGAPVRVSRRLEPAAEKASEQVDDHGDGQQAEEDPQHEAADDERQVDEPGGDDHARQGLEEPHHALLPGRGRTPGRRTLPAPDRKSTRLNSSHVRISYAVFCLKKKKKTQRSKTPPTDR